MFRRYYRSMMGAPLSQKLKTQFWQVPVSYPWHPRQPSLEKVTSRNSRLAPSGKVVAPSGSLGPVYCATYKTSFSFSLMLTRFGFTSKPRMPDTTRAVSAWPTADLTSAGTSFGLIFFTRTKFIASRGSIDNENAFTRMCCAIILSPFLVPLNSEDLPSFTKKIFGLFILYHTLHKMSNIIEYAMKIAKPHRKFNFPN